MKPYIHPHIKVEEQAPGYFVISGVKSPAIATKDGSIVPPEICVISAGVPSDLLAAIIEERGEAENPFSISSEEIQGLLDECNTMKVAVEELTRERDELKQLIEDYTKDKPAKDAGESAPKRTRKKHEPAADEFEGADAKGDEK